MPAYNQRRAPDRALAMLGERATTAANDSDDERSPSPKSALRKLPPDSRHSANASRAQQLGLWTRCDKRSQAAYPPAATDEV